MLSKCAISNINTEILTEISRQKSMKYQQKYEDRNQQNINKNINREKIKVKLLKCERARQSDKADHNWTRQSKEQRSDLNLI